MTTPTDISANLLEHWEDYKIMELLSINQLLLRIEKRNIIQKQHYVRKIIGHHKFMIDCHLNIMLIPATFPLLFRFFCFHVGHTKKAKKISSYVFICFYAGWISTKSNILHT